MSPLTAGSVQRRFLALTALRWLPTGLLIPITVLLVLSRGLTLAQFGAVFAAQGVVVLALELPTGGLADALGRRPTLLLATIVGLASLVLLAVAHSVPLFLAAFALQGIYRALDSGPLESWFVDATLAVQPETRIERALSAGAVVSSLAIGIGALLSGGLVTWRPFDADDPLVLPVLAAIALTVVYFVGLLVLLIEVRPTRDIRSIVASIRTVPEAIAGGIRLLGSSRVLLALVAVELLWGFGMVAFESMTPVRLAEVVGGSDQAAALMGPASSAAWLASAVGAVLVVAISRHIGVAPAAGLMRILQGGTVVVMGLSAGPIGVLTAFLACYLVHGASNPMHNALLHRQVTGSNRTLVLSMNSMVGQPAFAVGSVVLGGVAGGFSVATAMVVAGLVLAAAAPLYLPAWRSGQATRAAISAPADAPSHTPRAAHPR